MKRFYFVFTMLLLVGVTMNSCELITQFTDNEVMRTLEGEVVIQESDYPDYFAEQLKEFENVLINTYQVNFKGRTLNMSGGMVVSTTFNYTVSGTGKRPQLDSFFLQTPTCAGLPISWSPSPSSKQEDGAIKWNSSVSSDGSQDYSITYNGEVPLGIITATIVRGSNVESADVVGPCNGVFIISGHLFIDANADGSKQFSESGLSDFPISLKKKSDPSKVIAEVPTAADGSYSIKVLKGDYLVESLDKLLNENYTPSTFTSFEVKVDQDKKGINFGYLIESGKIIKEIEEGVILVNTENTNFWRTQISRAGKRGNYTVAEIDAFLEAIENLLLPEPFKFEGDKKKHALAILSPSKPPKNQTEIEKFLAQLLTGELNIVSGRGALTVVNGETVLDEKFNMALLIYSEARACEAMGTCPSSNERLLNTSFKTASIGLIGDTQLLAAFNGSGGVKN